VLLRKTPLPYIDLVLLFFTDPLFYFHRFGFLVLITLCPWFYFSIKQTSYLLTFISECTNDTFRIGGIPAVTRIGPSGQHALSALFPAVDKCA